MNTSGSSEAGSASYLLPSVWLKVPAGKGFFLVLLAPLRSQGLYLQATQTGIKGIGQSVPTKTLDFGSKNLGRFPLGCCCHANLAWVVVPSFSSLRSGGAANGQNAPLWAVQERQAGGHLSHCHKFLYKIEYNGFNSLA